MNQKINGLADIQIGYQFRGKVETDSLGTHKVIQIRDLDSEFRLNTDSCWTVTPKGNIFRYLVSKGDVLFLARGQRNHAVAITQSLQSTIAAGYFYIIRIKSELILPEYLAWFINQAPAQQYLHNTARRGTHMPLIPLSAFANLEVNLPDLNMQQLVVDLSKLQEREDGLLREIQAKRSLLIKRLSLKAVKKER